MEQMLLEHNRKLEKRKSQIKTVILALVVVFFLIMSFLSLSSIHNLQGNARVINYVGIVRGATQRLVKKELMEQPDDALIVRLDSIVSELTSGQGPNGLVVLEDGPYLDNMRQVQSAWAQIKEEILRVRAGGDRQTLYRQSEDYFFLVDRTVSSAEEYTERIVGRSIKMLIGVNIIFGVLVLVGALFLMRSQRTAKSVAALGKIAFIDRLTGLPNRASCDQYVEELQKEQPEICLAVFMFDMNFIKRVNDALGHHGGDKLIADFATILSEETGEEGFVSRYGGDEFLVILPEGNEEKASSFMKKVNERVVAYNLLHIHELEKINFTAGYCIESMKDHQIKAMIEEADRRMFVRKRQMMKESDNEQA